MANLAQGQRKAREFESRRLEEDLLELEKMPAFRRFMWRLCQRCGLTDVINNDSGSAQFRFEGRRQIALESLREFDGVLREAGPHAFYSRVIAAAQAYQREMDKVEPDKGEEQDNG